MPDVLPSFPFGWALNKFSQPHWKKDPEPPQPEGPLLEERPQPLSDIFWEGAQAGSLGGPVGGAGTRAVGLANEKEFQRLNREFMIDRARRRARQGLGGTSLEDLGDYAATVLSEEGRMAHTGMGRYVPYGIDLPPGAQVRLGVWGGDQAPVILGDGQRIDLEGSDLLEPGTRLSIERDLADTISGGAQVDPRAKAGLLSRLSRDATSPKFREYGGAERPISDIDLGRSGISREYAELAHPEARGRADFARSAAGEAERDARSKLRLVSQQIDALRQDWDDEFLRPGRYASVFTPEQRGYPLEDLSPGQTSRVLHPADTASNWNILDHRGVPSSFPHPDLFTEAGQRAYNEGLEGNIYFDRDDAGRLAAFSLPGGEPDTLETSLYVEPETNTPRRNRLWEERRWAEKTRDDAIRARDALYDQTGRQSWDAPQPSRASRVRSALKAGIKGALNPANLLMDATLGAGVGGLSSAAGYKAGQPDIQHKFTPPPSIREELQRPDPYTGEVLTRHPGGRTPTESEVRRATTRAEVREQDPNFFTRMKLIDRIDEANRRFGEGSVPYDATLEELERMFPDVMRDWIWEE